jgi:hypothetical protein
VEEKSKELLFTSEENKEENQIKEEIIEIPVD